MVLPPAAREVHGALEGREYSQLGAATAGDARQVCADGAHAAGEASIDGRILEAPDEVEGGAQRSADQEAFAHVVHGAIPTVRDISVQRHLCFRSHRVPTIYNGGGVPCVEVGKGLIESRSRGRPADSDFRGGRSEGRRFDVRASSSTGLNPAVPLACYPVFVASFGSRRESSCDLFFIAPVLRVNTVSVPILKSHI